MRSLAYSASQKYAKSTSNEPAKFVDARDPKMPKKNGRRERDGQKTSRREMTMRFCRPVKKQDGGLAMRDGENGVIETTTAIEMGLPKPTGMQPDVCGCRGREL